MGKRRILATATKKEYQAPFSARGRPRLFHFTPLEATERFREDSLSGARSVRLVLLKKVAHQLGYFKWLFDSYQVTRIVDNSQFGTWNL